MKAMTELNWLKLSGLMHHCIYNNENPQCPFSDYRKLDYFQQYQTLDKLSDSTGKQMLIDCGSCRHQCKAVKIKVEPINNARHFRIIG